MTPPIDRNHLSPTGQRVSPVLDDDEAYPPGFPELALQRYMGEKSRRRTAEAALDESTAEVNRLGKLYMEFQAKVYRLEAIVSRLRDIVAERDAEIDTLRSMIDEEDK